jgi:cell wall-associated NlpC family hydrolase
VISRPVPYSYRRHGGGAGVWLLAILALLLASKLDPASIAPPTQGRHQAATADAPAPAGVAARAVAFALAQRDKPYRWGAEGPDAYDCSGLAWAAWRHAGIVIPRTAAGQLAGLSRVRGPLRPGDLLVYATSGPSRRHVAMVAGSGRMVEAPGVGIPVRVRPIRRGWLGAVRPSGGAR